jgi:hypothetical protein
VVYPCAALNSQHRYLLPAEGVQQKDAVLPIEIFAKADAAPAKADTPSIVEIAEDEVVVVQGVVRLPPKVRMHTFSYVYLYSRFFIYTCIGHGSFARPSLKWGRLSFFH